MYASWGRGQGLQRAWGGGVGGVSGEEEDFSPSVHWLIIWVSKMPLFLPKMNSYFLFCFVFTVKASALEKNALWEQSALGEEYFFWCALNLFSSSGFQTCNGLGWVFKLQSPVGGEGAGFQVNMSISQRIFFYLHPPPPASIFAVTSTNTAYQATL